MSAFFRCGSPSTALAALVIGVLAIGCGTIDLGDNLAPPDLQLDEDYFFCVIQPQVLIPKHCSGGDAGEAGQCHSARSSLRLVDTMAPPPDCVDGEVVGGTIPADYRTNLEAVRFTVQSDPLSSPFYRRPTGLDSHPRVVFAETDPEAALVVEWINRGAL